MSANGISENARALAAELVDRLHNGCECSIPYHEDGEQKTWCPPRCSEVAGGEYGRAMADVDDWMNTTEATGWFWTQLKRIYGFALAGHSDVAKRNAAASALAAVRNAIYEATVVASEMAIGELGGTSVLNEIALAYSAGEEGGDWVRLVRSLDWDQSEVVRHLVNAWPGAVERASVLHPLQVPLPDDVRKLIRAAGRAYRVDGGDPTNSITASWRRLILAAASAAVPGLAADALRYWWPTVSRTGLVSAGTGARLAGQDAWSPAVQAHQQAGLMADNIKAALEMARQIATNRGWLPSKERPRAGLGAAMRIVGDIPGGAPLRSALDQLAARYEQGREWPSRTPMLQAAWSRAIETYPDTNRRVWDAIAVPAIVAFNIAMTNSAPMPSSGRNQAAGAGSAGDSGGGGVLLLAGIAALLMMNKKR